MNRWVAHGHVVSIPDPDGGHPVVVGVAVSPAAARMIVKTHNQEVEEMDKSLAEIKGMIRDLRKLVDGPPR